jgi:hypothetical protein
MTRSEQPSATVEDFEDATMRAVSDLVEAGNLVSAAERTLAEAWAKVPVARRWRRGRPPFGPSASGMSF